MAFEALQGLPRPARGTHGSLKVAAHVSVKPWFTAPPPCTFHCFVRKVKKNAHRRYTSCAGSQSKSFLGSHRLPPFHCSMWRRQIKVSSRASTFKMAVRGSQVLFCGQRPLPFGGSHLRLPSGPAGIRTTTGSLSALARPTPYQLSHRVACTGFSSAAPVTQKIKSLK